MVHSSQGLEGNIDEGGESGWKAKPMVATNREEVLSGAGSRYTYSANTMAFPEAKERGLSSLALVGMSCQTSIAPVMWHRKVGKVSKPIKLNIGLLCSKAFDDSMFDELFWVKYGLHKDDIKKMNIKGVFQVWMNNGDYHEINLKECHAWTREGCNHCPDFAAEHADISTGGIGEVSDWTLTIVRTDLGRAVIEAMVQDGVIKRDQEMTIRSNCPYAQTCAEKVDLDGQNGRMKAPESDSHRKVLAYVEVWRIHEANSSISPLEKLPSVA